MVDFILIFFGVIIVSPVIIFLHELGHAIFMLIFSNDRVLILLGDITIEKTQLHFGRLELGINKFYRMGGYAKNKGNINNRLGLILTSLGGPLMSAVIFVVSCITIKIVEQYLIKIIMTSCFNYSLFQLIITGAPLKYKRGIYKGKESDGYVILKLLKREGSF